MIPRVGENHNGGNTVAGEGGGGAYSGPSSTGFEFRPFLSMPPAQFRCQLNSQHKSRHHTGPGRTLVYIQRTSSARAVPPPTQRLPIQGPYSDLLIRCAAAGRATTCITYSKYEYTVVQLTIIIGALLYYKNPGA